MKPRWCFYRADGVRPYISMRARYYDADVGRFISEDPAGFVDGTNLYAYVGGNPIKYVDPTGYLSVLIGVEGTAAFGGGGNVAGGAFCNRWW